MAVAFYSPNSNIEAATAQAIIHVVRHENILDRSVWLLKIDALNEWTRQARYSTAAGGGGFQEGRHHIGTAVSPSRTTAGRYFTRFY